MLSKLPIAGIDVSKDAFNVHFGIADAKYPNNRKGFKCLCDSVPSGSVFAMEATGAYHYRLACYLHSKGGKVMVLNPYRVKHWIISESDNANDDRHAAINISAYAAVLVSKGFSSYWEPMSPKLARARVIVSLLKRFSKISVSCSNANHAIGYMLGKSDNLLGLMPDLKSFCKSRRKSLKNELMKLVKDLYPEAFHLLQTIPGIGSVTAAVFCVLTKGFDGFYDSRRLVSFLGLSPKFHESGTSIKSRRHISKTGNPYFRGLLYMCAMTACKCNKPCIDLYKRLVAKGKSGMCAMTAVMHRLVKIAFGVVSSGEPYRGGRMASASA